MNSLNISAIKHGETEIIMKEKFTKIEKSWILYDWANSSYATIMLAVIFPIYFTSVANSAGQVGDYWWGVGTSIATGITAILAPVLGAVGDYKGMKKRLFTVFLFVGLFGTAYCAITDIWQGMLIGYTISHIGFSGSCLFYDSFLTDVTTRERMDKVSSWGYAMGYIGGSTIPFLISIFFILFGENFGVDSTNATKLALVINVVWWAVFSIPFMKNCKQMHGIDVPEKNHVRETLTSLLSTLKKIVKNKGVFIFIMAYFFYIDGVNTVITMSTAYGTSLGLDSTGMIIALLVTQIVAFPSAIYFGHIAKKVGTINMLTFSVCFYIFICVLGFVMGFGLEEEFLTVSQALTFFWCLSVCVGLVQGGIQALSRSYYGKLVPPKYSSEYFGVFDIFGKFAAIMGPAIYAIVLDTTGRSSLAIFAIALLFIAGGILLVLGRKHFNVSEGSAQI